MLKICGFFLILISSSCFGFIASNRLKLRLDNLGKLIVSLSVIENEVAYGKNDIEYIIRSLEKPINMSWITDISKIENSASIKDEIYQNLSQEDFNLTNSDKHIIKEFLFDFGNMDSISQLKSINRTKKQLLNAKEDAKNNYLLLGKLYRSMGVLCGLLFSILLI